MTFNFHHTSNGMNSSSRATPIRVSINRRWPGEKLINGDPRWGEYNGAFQTEEHTAESFFREVAEGGHAFCAALQGYRSSDNFLSSQVLALDVDSENRSVAELLEDPFIQQHATFIYPTISWAQENRKWRVVFVLTEAITDPSVYRKAATALLARYSTTDQQVKDPARLFFGTKPGNGQPVFRGGLLPLAEVLKLVSDYEDIRREANKELSRRQLPAIDSKAITGNTSDERYVNRAVQEEFAWLAQQVKGNGTRHHGLLVASARLESLRLSEWLAPEARAMIDPYAVLLQAARANGYLDEYGEDDVRRAIAWGVGVAEPRPMPPDWRQRSSNGGGIGANGRQEGQAADAPPTGEPRCTDMGNAARFAAQHGTDVRYCYAYGRWYAWDGRRWAEDDTGEIVRRAKAVVRSMYQEAAALEDEERRAKLAKWAATSESEARIRAMISLAQSEPGIAVRPDAFDRDPWKLNVLNGTLDLRTGQLRPHRREDFITKLAPVEYTPDAPCPLWETFLDRICSGSPSVIGFLQRMAGYALTGDTREKALLIFWGRGNNGKTTLVETLASMLGNYAMRTPAETLLVKRDGTIPNDLARLRGARFVWASEPDADRQLAEGLVKDVTGRDTISARFLWAEWFDFKPEFKLVLSTNHKPIIKGTDPAIWERIRLVPFKVSIPPGEQDKELPLKLQAELSGILRWAVQGCLDWQREGLGLPGEVTEATNQYREDMDAIGGFIGECCTTGPRVWAKAGDLYKNYTGWCKANGEEPLSQRQFGQHLGERGFRRYRGTGNAICWGGIGVVDDRYSYPSYP